LTETLSGAPVGEFGIPEEIAQGVYLLRMPLPFRLNHINLYLLDDPAGWTIVDCGLNKPESMAVWESVFATLMRDKPVIRIIVTHLHPDHIGLAHWLHSKTRAPIFMTAPEWQQAQRVFHLPVLDPARIEAHYRRLGLTDEPLQTMIRQASSYRKLVKVLPEHVHYLHEHETLDIGGRRWRILLGHGHSPACACLWDETDQLLIVGDHVLPTISSNINLLAVGPHNPLDDYLTSLSTFRGLPCHLFLPAHGPRTSRLHARIDELIAHHSAHLERLYAACAEPRTAADCVPLLFGNDLPDHQFFFAIGESAAHLVYLTEQGRLKQDGDQSWQFARC
jgi:glyoxylase-like metal-dependent hydrolase (beta-lactamase superfamily II)